MADIEIEYVNNIHCRIHCEPGILQELIERFTFYVPGYKFSPKYKMGFWDGRICLIQRGNGQKKRLIFNGLQSRISEFAISRNYTLTLPKECEKTEFSEAEALQAIQSFDIPEKFETRDYQLASFLHCIQERSVLLESPTASGKSMIIYNIIRHLNRKTLIIVPTKNLVHQLYSDFQDYGFDSDAYVHKLYGGQERTTDKPIVISTWQTVIKMVDDEDWMGQWEVVIGDEAHNCKAKSLVAILSNLKNAAWRYGFTGSMSEDESSRLTVEGLFGPIKKFVSTKELIDQGRLAALKIEAVVFKHPPDKRKLLARAEYADEIEWLITNERRNKFIKTLATSLDGNVLILSTRVEKHLIPLHKIISESTDRPVHLVHGKIDAEDREAIRQLVMTQSNSIILASSQCFSEGVNIPNLKYLIFATPSKARIKILQAIGRVLRTSEDKYESTLFDLADDISHKKWINHTLKHYAERIKYYNQEEFPYTQNLVEL